jgi:hypothetical protein
MSGMSRCQQDRGWWSVRVDLLGGGLAGELWPCPGRVFAVSPAHTFHTFAEAIDDAFARWDRSHLHQFTLPKLDQTLIWRTSRPLPSRPIRVRPVRWRGLGRVEEFRRLKRSRRSLCRHPAVWRSLNTET